MLAEMPFHAVAEAMGAHPSTLGLRERSGLLTLQRIASGHRAMAEGSQPDAGSSAKVLRNCPAIRPAGFGYWRSA